MVEADPFLGVLRLRMNENARLLEQASGAVSGMTQCKPMTAKISSTENGIEPRTRRACEESMVVVPHGGGSGMFDVYSESGGEYVVDLRDDVCSCLDFTHREPAGGCKHIRRVRLELGIEDVPAGVRDEHAAPTDVELARRRRGIGVEENENESGRESEPEPEPEIEVEPVEQAARAVVTDGGQLLEGEPEPEPRDGSAETTGAEVDGPVHHSLEANRIAAETVADADGRLPDFHVYCAVVEETQDTLLKMIEE